MPRPQPTPVDNPIVVFVSSSQREFQQLRDYLKLILEEDDFLRRGMVKVELAERRSGERIRGDISQALSNSSIYVGIFGNRYSPITIAEYFEARRCGLPLVIFDMVKTGSRDRRVRVFLSDQVKEKDDCRLTEIRFRPSKSESVAWLICQRVANTIANLVREDVEVRKKVHPQ
ncbi:MAG: DUF4062 domain-containing protein [Candidatus Bathyarchaeia archaeon]